MLLTATAALVDLVVVSLVASALWAVDMVVAAMAGVVVGMVVVVVAAAKVVLGRHT